MYRWYMDAQTANGAQYIASMHGRYIQNCRSCACYVYLYCLYTTLYQLQGRII